MSSEAKNKGIIVFLILLISLICYFSYQNIQDYNDLKASFKEEKKALESDLDKIILDYDRIIDKGVMLESRLKEKKLMVIQFRDSLNTIEENNFKLIRAYRNRISSLEEENRTLFLKIDYLNNENNALLSENDKVKEELKKKVYLTSKLRNQNKKLNNYSTGLQEKVDIASEIEVVSVKVSAIKQKAQDKNIETTKHKKTDAFRVSFRVRENKIAQSGQKNIYISVFDEDNNIISSKGNIELRKGYTPYSSLVSFYYKNSEALLFSIIEVNKKELDKGRYFFKLFLGGELINTSVLVLK